MGATTEPFDLDEERTRELEESIAEADRGEVVPAADVLARPGGGRSMSRSTSSSASV